MVKSWFPLARKCVSTSQNEGFVSKLRFHKTRKTYHWQKCLKKIKSVSTSQNAIKNTFPLNGKIKLAVSGWSASNWKKKNGFHYPENQFLLAGIRLFFKNWIFRFPQTEKKISK